MSWASKLAKPYRISDGDKFRLKYFDPEDTGDFRSEEHASELLKKGISRLADLQDKLYAQDNWAVLIILQAIDAAGKDGIVKHVMSGLNPQGARFIRLTRLPWKNWITIISGVPRAAYRSGAASASSIVRMKRYWWCGCIRSCCKKSESPKN